MMSRYPVKLLVSEYKNAPTFVSYREFLKLKRVKNLEEVESNKTKTAYIEEDRCR